MKKILVPTDFSANAMKAALYAAEIADRSGASVYFLHVHEPGYIPLDEKYNTVIAGYKLDLQDFHTAVAKEFPGVTMHTVVRENDSTVKALLDYSQEQFDIIIMGTQGRTAVTGLLFGSVASSLIQKSKIPVLAVPAGYNLEQPDAIVFATNHFEKDERILNRLADLSQMFSAKLHVVTFLDTDTAEAADYIERTRKITEYFAFLKHAYPQVQMECELLEGSNFESALELYNSRHEVDMVALVPYPKTILDKMLQQSVTRKMALQSGIPVLAIPATGAEG